MGIIIRIKRLHLKQLLQKYIVNILKIQTPHIYKQIYLYESNWEKSNNFPKLEN